MVRLALIGSKVQLFGPFRAREVGYSQQKKAAIHEGEWATLHWRINPIGYAGFRWGPRSLRIARADALVSAAIRSGCVDLERMHYIETDALGACRSINCTHCSDHEEGFQSLCRKDG